MALLSACETVIEIDPPDYDSELNVGRKFSPDSVWIARITATIPIGNRPTNQSYILLKNATAMVHEGDVLVDQLIHDGSSDSWCISSKEQTPIQ